MDSAQVIEWSTEIHSNVSFTRILEQVLLVTTLLSLVTMFDTVRNNSPNALELKCIEVCATSNHNSMNCAISFAAKCWISFHIHRRRFFPHVSFSSNGVAAQVWLISCTLFVFLALMEYFIVLFGIRYDKHWRRAKPKPSSSNTAHHLTTTVTGASATTNLSQASENDVSSPNLLLAFPVSILGLIVSISVWFRTQRKPALEQAARAFSTMNKITPETRAKFSTMAAKRREEALINEANCIPPPPPSSLSQSSFFGNRRRYVRTRCILCGLAKWTRNLPFSFCVLCEKVSKCCRKCNFICWIAAWATRSNFISPVSNDISSIRNQLLDRLLERIKTQTIKLKPKREKIPFVKILDGG